MHNCDREITILLSETILLGIWEYSATSFTKPEASTISTQVMGEDIVDGRHIQFRMIQIFLLFYFYSFNVVFEDKPSAALTS